MIITYHEDSRKFFINYPGCLQTTLIASIITYHDVNRKFLLIIDLTTSLMIIIYHEVSRKINNLIIGCPTTLIASIITYHLRIRLSGVLADNIDCKHQK